MRTLGIIAACVCLAVDGGSATVQLPNCQGQYYGTASELLPRAFARLWTEEAQLCNCPSAKGSIMVLPRNYCRVRLLGCGRRKRNCPTAQLPRAVLWYCLGIIAACVCSAVDGGSATVQLPNCQGQYWCCLCVKRAVHTPKLAERLEGLLRQDTRGEFHCVCACTCLL